MHVFPTLQGLSIERTLRPDFNTNVFEAASGHETRHKLRSYPKWTFTLNMEVLLEDRDDLDLTELVAFFLNRFGRWDSFLYDCPNDNAVELQTIGTGDGVATTFQLVRDWGIADGELFREPTENIKAEPIPQLLINELLIADTDYSIGATGIVTFTTPPEVDAIIQWTGGYYYCCRFAEDGYDFEQLLCDAYQCNDVSFIGSVKNLVKRAI